LLREELGFTGLVVTDALDMNAVSATVGMEQGAVLSLAAGADALCLGAGLDDTPVASIHRAIVEAVRDGRLAEERLREAAGRVRGRDDPHDGSARRRRGADYRRTAARPGAPRRASPRLGARPRGAARRR